MQNKFAAALLAAALAASISRAQVPSALPHLETRGNATQLIVDGQPFLMLGGELHNSSSSSLAYMQSVWPRLAAMHLNTVLTPIAWETTEPTEGHFDFTTVDGLLQGARDNHLHLVVLWFGSWKNTFSTYVPTWVKHDTTRFPRVQTADGSSTERLSPFSAAVTTADAHAFAALLHHLREADTQHTVLMVQVENEVGVLPESRDHSAAANAAFEAPVPTTLTSYLASHRSTLNPELRAAWESAGAKSSGTWLQLFGNSPLTDDLFMAWSYATAIEPIAAAGKAELPLALYTNAALIRPNYQPGQYNSGGPLPHSIDIWRAAAPSLNFFSPDIYFNEFALWSGFYTRPGNPLFIPEAQGGEPGAANALFAFGRLSAIGFSVFGIDDQGNAPLDLGGITHGEHLDTTAIASTYSELAQLSPLILEKQQHAAITTAILEGEAQRAARVSIGDYTATLTRTSSATNRAAAMFLQTAPNEFLVLAAGDAQITFSAETPGPPIVAIESIDELFASNGTLIPGRRLNGDETAHAQSLRLSSSDPGQARLYRVRLYRYK